MADINSKKILFALTEETTPGTPEAVASADFIEVTAEGVTMSGPREKVETNILSGSKLIKKSQKTVQNGEFSGAVYLRAGANAGDTPEADLLLRGLGCSKETVATKTALLSGSTTTVLQVASGDELKYKVGQGILLDGKHKSFIVGLDDGEITLGKALASAPAAGLEIEKLVAYRLDDKNPITYTARKFFAGKVTQEIPGCKTGEMSCTATAGQIPTQSFSGMGINFFEVLETLGVSPSWSNAEYPAAIESCLLKNGSELEGTEFSWTIAATQTKKNTLCAENVIKELITTDFAISGSAQVYKKDDDVSIKPGDTKFSLFISFHIPAGANGEKSGVVCAYFPNVKIDEVDNNGELEGLVSQSITWVCEPSDEANTVPVFTYI